MYLIAGASRVMSLHRQIQIGRPLRLAIYRQLPSAGYRSNKLPSARASVTRIRCPFRSSTDVGYIDKRIVAAAVGANGSASLWNTGCQGILPRGKRLFIQGDPKPSKPLKTPILPNPPPLVQSTPTTPPRTI